MRQDDLTSNERPVFVPAVRKPKLPYLCGGAECVTCMRPVSGDWGLVPAECDTCDAERRARYYRDCAQWADAEIYRLTRELAMWLQVWDNVKLDNPDLREDNKPLAVAACYALLKLEADRMREALVMSVNAMREPFDGWKGEVEALALAAARAALGDSRDA